MHSPAYAFQSCTCISAVAATQVLTLTCGGLALLLDLVVASVTTRRYGRLAAELARNFATAGNALQDLMLSQAGQAAR